MKTILCIACLCLTASTWLCPHTSAAERVPSFTIRRVTGAAGQEIVTAVPSIVMDVIRSSAKPGAERLSAGVAVIGDSVSNPIIVGTIPFSDQGNTALMTDDYHESCPFPGGGAPDAVYQYTPATNQVISIDLCGSSYDTKVYVYENSVTPGAAYACNDDYCGPNFVQSYIPSLLVSAGATYFIAVDGYAQESGEYSIAIVTDDACIWAGCAPSATPEGEVCAAGTDVTNGGCSVLNQQFSDLDDGQTVCGLIWAELPSRDTDWYRVQLVAGKMANWTVRAEFPFTIFIFELVTECEDIIGVRFEGDPCEEIVVELETQVTGDYALVVTTREQYGGYPCSEGPWQYETTFEADCICACHADPAQLPNPGECDGVVSVSDVVTIVNLAFRGAPPIYDPYDACPFERGDVDCNGSVSVSDVVRLVNVAFRGQPPSEQFVDPCAAP